MLNSCQKLVGTCWNSVLVLNIFHWHFPTLKTSLKNPDPILIIWKSSIRYKVDTAVLSAWHDGAENFRFTEDILEHDSLDPPPGSEIFLKQPSMDSISISKGFQHFLDFRSPKIDVNDIRAETLLSRSVESWEGKQNNRCKACEYAHARIISAARKFSSK